MALAKEGRYSIHSRKRVPVLRKFVVFHFFQPCGWMAVKRRVFRGDPGESPLSFVNPPILILSLYFFIVSDNVEP